MFAFATITAANPAVAAQRPTERETVACAMGTTKSAGQMKRGQVDPKHPATGTRSSM